MPAPEVHDLFIPGCPTAVVMLVSTVGGIPVTNPYGDVELESPVEIPVRWNDTRKEITDANGNLVSIEAEVVVGINIPPGSKMWLGSLSDWLGSGSSGGEPEIMEVVGYYATPDVKGRVNRRTVSLKRFRGALPQSYT